METNWDGTYPPCLYTLDRWLVGQPTPFSVTGGEAIPAAMYNNFQGYLSSSNMMTGFNDLYSNWGYRFGSAIGTSTYNTIEDNVYSICQTSPGSCSDMLTNYCSQYSADDLAANPNLVRWCGCYLPDSEYVKYVNQYQINKECSPLCARNGNIPMVDPVGTTPVVCNSDTCLIDAISVNLINTTVNGGINFSQICGGCGGDVTINGDGTSSATSSCTCIMENNTISGFNSSIGGSINLNQQCGSSICYQDNPDVNGPAKIQIDCASAIGTVTSSETGVTSTYDVLFPYAFIGFILLVLLFLLVVWWNARPKPPTGPILTTDYNPLILYA